MAQAARVQRSPSSAAPSGDEFVQLKDGTYAWLNPVTGEITPARRQKEWDKLFALLEEHGPAPQEFMEGIEDPQLTFEEIF